MKCTYTFFHRFFSSSSFTTHEKTYRKATLLLACCRGLELLYFLHFHIVEMVVSSVCVSRTFASEWLLVISSLFARVFLVSLLANFSFILSTCGVILVLNPFCGIFVTAGRLQHLSCVVLLLDCKLSYICLDVFGFVYLTCFVLALSVSNGKVFVLSFASSSWLYWWVPLRKVD